jgi:hypothetical protein
MLRTMSERTYVHRQTGRRIRERRVTAHHEAAHAIVAMSVGLAVACAGLADEMAGDITHSEEFDWLAAAIDVYRLSLGAARANRDALAKALRGALGVPAMQADRGVRSRRMRERSHRAAHARARDGRCR